MRARRALGLLALSCWGLPAFAAAVQSTDKSQGPVAVKRQPVVASPPSAAWRPILRGRLGNGLRYAILPRRANEPGVGLFMRVDGGFLAERRPGERGLAHLIEHLVFHSPTRTAPDQRERFRQVGFPLSLPEPAGGTTSWRESDYFVVSRTTRPADLDALLGLFREVADELTFRADTVDEQRAELMREMANKKLGNDIYARYIAAVAPGSPTDVIDAQNSDDVPTASVETIRTLYHRLYRPENTTIVIVGDVDASRIKAVVEKRFGDWRGVGSAPERRPIPTFDVNRIASVSHSALPQGRNTAMVTVAAPLPPLPPTPDRQAEAALMDLLAIRAVNDRLTLQQPENRRGKNGFFIENGEQGHRLFILWDEPVSGQWRATVAGLKRTACALNDTGFSDAEWSAAKRGLIEELDQRAKDMAGTPNFLVARDLANAVTYGREFLSPDALLRHARTWLPTVDARKGNGWWRRQWRAGVEHVRVETPELARVADPDVAIRTAVGEAVADESCKRGPW